MLGDIYHSILYNRSKLDRDCPQMKKLNDFWQISFVEIIFCVFKIILMIKEMPTISIEECLVR